YAHKATPFYRSSARLVFDQNAPKVHSNITDHSAYSDTYIQTQVDVFRSSNVLSRAMNSLDYRNLKTFADAGGNPVTWLRKGNLLTVESPKKSDIVIVSMEAPD